MGAKDVMHPYFGELRYDERLGLWQGTVPGTQPPVGLHVWPDDANDPASALVERTERIARR